MCLTGFVVVYAGIGQVYRPSRRLWMTVPWVITQPSMSRPITKTISKQSLEHWWRSRWNSRDQEHRHHSAWDTVASNKIFHCRANHYRRANWPGIPALRLLKASYPSRTKALKACANISRTAYHWLDWNLKGHKIYEPLLGLDAVIWVMYIPKLRHVIVLFLIK